jgi:hypothetical protein
MKSTAIKKSIDLDNAIHIHVCRRCRAAFVTSPGQLPSHDGVTCRVETNPMPIEVEQAAIQALLDIPRRTLKGLSYNGKHEEGFD